MANEDHCDCQQAQTQDGLQSYDRNHSPQQGADNSSRDRHRHQASRHQPVDSVGPGIGHDSGGESEDLCNQRRSDRHLRGQPEQDQQQGREEGGAADAGAVGHCGDDNRRLGTDTSM